MIEYSDQPLMNPSFEVIPYFNGQNSSPIQFLEFETFVRTLLTKYDPVNYGNINSILDRIEYPATLYVDNSSIRSVYDVLEDLHRNYGGIYGPYDYVHLINETRPRYCENFPDFTLRLQEIVRHAQYNMQCRTIVEFEHALRILQCGALGKLARILPGNYAAHYPAHEIKSFRDAHFKITEIFHIIQKQINKERDRDFLFLFGTVNFNQSLKIRENSKDPVTEAADRSPHSQLIILNGKLCRKPKSSPVENSIESEDLTALEGVQSLFEINDNFYKLIKYEKSKLLTYEIFQSIQEEFFEVNYAISSVESSQNSTVLSHELVSLDDRIEVHEPILDKPTQNPVTLVTGGETSPCFVHNQIHNKRKPTEKDFPDESFDPNSWIKLPESHYFPGINLQTIFDPACKISWYLLEEFQLLIGI